jgi:hypothetical protein
MDGRDSRRVDGGSGSRIAGDRERGMTAAVVIIFIFGISFVFLLAGWGIRRLIEGGARCPECRSHIRRGVKRCPNCTAVI